MNWTISVPDGEGMIRVKLCGDYDLSSNLRLLKEIGVHTREHPSYSLLFDNREFTGGQMTPNEMVVSSGLFADSEAGISARRIAIITPTDREAEKAVQWGRITHSQSMTRIAVFQDEAEAVEWLRSKD
jgi:hypothetical protein